MYKNDSLYLINEIIRIIDSLEDFNISASRVFEFINSQKYKKEHYGNVHIKEFKGSITFNNVNFSYNPKNKILKNMNFKINPNETIGFVGKSGAGKTTVLSLINKMYNVNDNMIFLDNYDINTLDESSITNNITLVTQNPYIFNMSIKDNLKIVSKKASLSKIKEVRKIACIHDFIMSLPDKYDTKIGEGGVALSGGQRQRIAIARALIKQPKIIIADEPTGNLNFENGKRVVELLMNAGKKFSNTMIVVTHDDRLVKYFDEALHFEDMLIKEGGNENV